MAEKKDNLALDLDLFDDNMNGYAPARKEEVAPIPKPKIVKKKRKTKAQLKAEAKRSRIAAVKMIAVATAAFVIIGSMVYLKIVATNLSAELSQRTSDLSSSQSEGIRLQMRFNSIMSLDKIEEYAQSELGMVKKDTYKTNYYDISNADGVQYKDSVEVN